MALPVAAGADEDGDWLAATDVLPGTCWPTVVIPGQLVDCRFPLERVRPLDEWNSHVADLHLPYDDPDAAPCVVVGDELHCRGIYAYYAMGVHTVTPMISGVRSRATATFRVVSPDRLAITLSPAWGGEPYVVPGRAVAVYVDGPGRTEPSFAVVRSRQDGRAMATVAIPAASERDFEPIEIASGVLPAGRYVVTPCIGDSPLTCQEQEAGGVGFQVGTGRLREVIPGWNVAAADRINIVFAPAGDTTAAATLEHVRTVLGWEGPLLLDDRDRPGGSAVVMSIRFGPFAIEPLRSARHLFNLWLLDDVVMDTHALEHTAPPVGWDRPPPDFGLPFVHVTVVDTQYPGTFERSHAFWPSFSSPDGPSEPVKDGLVFGSAYLAVSRYNPLGYAETLTHEWGHALFDLRDEYAEYERGVTYGYPNCAPTEEIATAWWGTHLGEVDPFVDEVIAVHREHRVSLAPDLRERVTVGLVRGGCYSLRTDDAVRPTMDSMMNSEIPVFGTVNRLRVEQVLALWSGRAPFALESSVVTCSAVVRREAVLFCGFTLPIGMDAPDAPVVLRFGASRGRCAFEASEQGRFSCGVLRVDGPGPWLVDLEGGDRTRSVLVLP